MLDDLYFAQSSDGRGSKVETLPSGENLGQIDDLKFFNNKLIRGLGIPSSYLPTGPDDGTASYNDGRVGTAYIQEYRFNQYCQRLQSMLIDVFDTEFKLFIKQRGINIEAGSFDLEFAAPQNFATWRESELKSSQIQMFTQMLDIPFMSKRWLMTNYLGLTVEEMNENERLWKEENWKNLGKGVPEEVLSDGGMPGISSVGVHAPPMDDFADMGDSGDMGEGGDMGDMGEGGDIGGGPAGPTTAPEELPAGKDLF
jgi:hypothetical protein